MKKCKYCGAKWRLNYPYGRKSEARKIYINEHKFNCRGNKIGNK